MTTVRQFVNGQACFTMIMIRSFKNGYELYI